MRAQNWEVLAEAELLQTMDVPIPARALTVEQVWRFMPYACDVNLTYVLQGCAFAIHYNADYPGLVMLRLLPCPQCINIVAC